MPYFIVLSVEESNEAVAGWGYWTPNFEIGLHGFLTFLDQTGKKHIVKEWIEIYEEKE